MGEKNIKVKDDVYLKIDEMSEKKGLSKKEMVSIIVEFYEKHKGRVEDIENKARKIDLELKKIKEEAERKAGFTFDELKKRERDVMKKEALIESVADFLKKRNYGG